MKKRLGVITMTIVLAGGMMAGCSQQKQATESPAVQMEESVSETEQSAAETVATLDSEADQRYGELIQKENEILEEHSDQWNRIFDQMDKEEVAQKMENGQKYLDFLNEAVEKGKGELSEEEMKIVQEDLKKIEEIEKEMSTLVEKGVKP